MRILVVGDPYMDAAIFEAAFADLHAAHRITYVQLDGERALEARSPSEHAIREYIGHPDELVAAVDGHDALVVHGAPVTDAVLDAAPALRLVCCARGGPVNVDVGAATERGIPVAITPGKNAEAVADLTICFLVMLARDLPRAQRFLLDGGELGDSAFEGAQFFGRDLGGQTLGLIGLGQVGTRVARRASAFGMRVLACDPYVPASDGDGVTATRALDEVLAEADFVSLHARLTPETENLFDAGRFAAMKRGAWFVNTARELLVDERALAAALADGQLAGAALDVVRPTPAGERNPLLDDPRVIVTPHIGGATHETLLRGASMLAGELLRVDAGEPATNVINRSALEAAR